MKKFFLLFTVFLFSSTSLFAEYKLEPVNCTEKKKSNCGAYLYNTKTGSTYFCDSEKCKEILEALEESTIEEVSGESKNLRFLKSLKFLKKTKRKRNQKYQSLKRQNNLIFVRRLFNSYFYC